MWAGKWIWVNGSNIVFFYLYLRSGSIFAYWIIVMRVAMSGNNPSKRPDISGNYRYSIGTETNYGTSKLTVSVLRILTIDLDAKQRHAWSGARFNTYLSVHKRDA